MARTRGASNAFHQDDGELVDKEGKPISTAPHRPVGVLHMDDGEIVPPAPKEVAPAPVSVSAALAFQSDAVSWQRNMEAWEAMRLLSLMLGGLSITIAPAQWAELPADVRRHFRRVAAPVPPEGVG